MLPNGYLFEHIARGSRGGGVGLLFNKTLNMKKISFNKFKSFEAIGMTSNSSSGHFSVFVIYRPPPSAKNKFSISLFFDEFSTFLEKFSTEMKSFIIVGDFNFHVEDMTDAHALRFLNILECFNLTQHVREATYQGKHILDLVITRDDENIINNVSVSDPAISDHSAVFCNILISKPPFERRVSRCRKLKSVDLDSFSKDVSGLLLSTALQNDLPGLLGQYESVLTSVLDQHAPCKERVITVRPSSPWYTDEVKVAKVKRRRLERNWRKSRLMVDRQLYVDQCNLVRDLIKKAKNEFYSNIISENQSNQRVLFSTFQKWTNMKADQHFPSSNSSDGLANSFADFFESKISTIQAGFKSSSENVSFSDNSTLCHFLSFFEEISLECLSKIIAPLVLKSSELDPVPGLFLKSCFQHLLPMVTRIVNLSLSSGSFPSNLKEAIVKPILKKHSLSTEEFSNFRPVSNLKFISKAIEKVVAAQLTEHLNKNNLHEPFQSAYKKYHSVETALLRVQNDVLKAIDSQRSVILVLLDLSAAFDTVDSQRSVILVLLDLSAAFDTVDHKILLERMSSRFGINGLVLKWFESYLTDRRFRVSVQGSLSSSRSLQCGVPQGSILGPILFLIYTSPIGDIFKRSRY